MMIMCFLFFFSPSFPIPSFHETAHGMVSVFALESSVLKQHGQQGRLEAT